MNDLTVPLLIDDGLIKDLRDSMGGGDDEFNSFISEAKMRFLTVSDMTRRLVKARLALVNVYEISEYCYAEVSDTNVTFISERKFSFESTSQFKHGVAVIRELELGGASVNINDKDTFKSCFCNILLDKSRVCIQNGRATHGTFSKCYISLVDISNIKCDLELDIGDCFYDADIDELMADNCEITVGNCQNALRSYVGDVISFRNCKIKINCDITEAIGGTWVDTLDISGTTIEFDETIWSADKYTDKEKSEINSVIANNTVVNDIDKFIKVLGCCRVEKFTTNVSELQLAWNRHRELKEA